MSEKCAHAYWVDTEYYVLCVLRLVLFKNTLIIFVIWEKRLRGNLTTLNESHDWMKYLKGDSRNPILFVFQFAIPKFTLKWVFALHKFGALPEFSCFTEIYYYLYVKYMTWKEFF